MKDYCDYGKLTFHITLTPQKKTVGKKKEKKENRLRATPTSLAGRIWPAGRQVNTTVLWFGVAALPHLYSEGEHMIHHAEPASQSAAVYVACQPLCSLEFTHYLLSSALLL